MNEFPRWMTAACVVAVGIAACSGAKSDDKSAVNDTMTANTQADVSSKPTSDNACDLLTLEEATKVLGSGAKGGASNKDSPTESEHMKLTKCTYDNSDDSKIASLLVRAAKSETGTQANQRAFGSEKPAGAQDVSGYGDKAFWNPQFGQLNVLKHANWYIISNGPLTGSEKTLDQAKQLADLIISKL